MSGDKVEEVDVLIDPKEEFEQFKANPVQLSKEGENSYLLNQALYRKLDHERWAARNDRQADTQIKAHNEHLQTMNRFNLINSVVHFAALAAIVALLVKAVG